MTEAQIIAGCKAKERKAQRAFVDAYTGMLYSICKRYCNDDHMAKDYLQEALLHALYQIEKYTTDTNFKGWLHTLTVRKCLEQIRKSKNLQFESIEASEQTLSHFDNVQFKLEKDDVMLFVQSIPDNYRIVLIMYLVEGYSHKEIGAILEITESSSRTFLTRARKLITDHFSNNEVSLFRAS